MKYSIQNFERNGGRNIYGKPFSKLDMKRQLNVLASVFGHVNQVSDRRKSYEMKNERLEFSKNFIHDVVTSGFPIKNILNLSSKHVKAAVQQWKTAGQTAGTIRKKLSSVNWLLKSIGKAELVRSSKTYGIEEAPSSDAPLAHISASQIINDNLTPEILAKINKKNAWAAMSIELMVKFDLGVMESVLINPDYSDGFNSLSIVEGTKAGSRKVRPITSEMQRNALERAKEMSKNTLKYNLVPPGETPKTAARRVHYYCQIFQLRKN